MFDTELATTLDAYRTCEFSTIGRNGRPVAWPTSGLALDDGRFLLTTSLAFPQKAFNVRRNPRVALLFSDPTASGLEHPRQILLRGTAVCPDEIHTEPTGDLGRLWKQLFERQPRSRGYLRWPGTALADFYFMRLLITVTATEVADRPLPAAAAMSDGPLAGFPSVVLTAIGADGTPRSVRTTATFGPDGYAVAVPDDVEVAAGPASLLAHRHDAKLSKLDAVNVLGRLTEDHLLIPEKVVEPAPRKQILGTLRQMRTTTDRYLARRGLARPVIPWGVYRSL